jgi:hypothetical protein
METNRREFIATALAGGLAVANDGLYIVHPDDYYLGGFIRSIRWPV